MKVEQLWYQDLTKIEQQNAPGSGVGREDANYMRITYEDGDSHVESDAMEPEDAVFYRDLSWIESAIYRAYEQGRKDAQTDT